MVKYYFEEKHHEMLKFYIDKIKIIATLIDPKLYL